ncbi:MAG: hypothetical protein DA443_08985 [Bacteroidetes bacterium]|nr:MAG: hypothetical protein DA443_08985 [Bacteroidota bacterium]
MTYEVLLYYLFSPIENPQQFCDEHKEFLKELDVLGRVYVSSEGLNGTVAGTPEQMETYREYVRSLPGFAEIEFKTDRCDTLPFPKLTCKVREEIVALHVDGLDPAEGGRHLQPCEWRNVMESGEEYVMIDVRNNYESEVGHFEGAVRPDVRNFYDFPQWLDEADIPKDKKVLMYCTGGIRCEKFSVLMKQKGWEDVNQLHGGILNYAKEEGGEHFRGKCFVFDDRLVVPVNPSDLEPVAHCSITGKPADTYLNCANMECNKLFICSEEGARQMEGCCSEACMESEYRRPFDEEDSFRPFRKWYNYFGEEFKERETGYSG